MKDIPEAQDDRNKKRDSSGRFLSGNEYAIKPGEVKNPTGKGGKKKPITEELQRLLEMINPNDPDKRTNAKILADVLFSLAGEGKLDAIKEIADRAEGKATTSVELSGGVDINGNAKHLLVARIAALSKRGQAKEGTPESD